MININALFGSLIGVIIIFVFKKIIIILNEKNIVSHIFDIECILNEMGCWIFSLIYVVSYFFLNNKENVINYILLFIIINLTFQSLLNFFKNEFYYHKFKNWENILLSVI